MTVSPLVSSAVPNGRPASSGIRNVSKKFAETSLKPTPTGSLDRGSEITAPVKLLPNGITLARATDSTPGSPLMRSTSGPSNPRARSSLTPLASSPVDITIIPSYWNPVGDRREGIGRLAAGEMDGIQRTNSNLCVTRGDNPVGPSQDGMSTGIIPSIPPVK
jgi:hypothetical protein